MTDPPPLGSGLHAVEPGQLACVVTRLGMMRPARLPAEGGPAAGVLRRVRNPELGWYRDLFRRIGGPWLWSSRLRLDNAALGAIIGHPDMEIWTLVHEGTDAGLLELDFRMQDDGEIAFLGVAAALTGRGLGRLLMAQALRRAWARPIIHLGVQTCTLDHPRALGFYRRSGFAPIATAVEVMDDPRLDGTLPHDAAPWVPLL